MAITRFRPGVGPKRIVGSVRGGISQGYARDLKAQMDNIIKNYNRFVRHVEDVTPEILLEALKPAFDTSQKYVPERTGALKRSGYLTKTTFRGNPTVEIGYAKGGSPNYAPLVHERTDLAHKAPTRAKFLQAALSEHETQIERDVIDLTRRASGL